MMTRAEYIESLRRLNLKDYFMGEMIENPVDHPMIRPSMNSVAKTYELAEKPEYQDLMTVYSPLIGKRINRFCHLHQSTEDLVNKVKMQRLMGQKTAACFQRCVGMDAFNAIFSTTYEMDQKLGTEYHKRFNEYKKFVQEIDLTDDGAMTDPKGDRSLSPSRQEDPDMYMHVVEVREDGIVVRGAKAHQTGAVNSHEHLIMPTVAMKEEDKDYAISFAVPSDAEGVFMVYGRQSCDTRKMEENADMDLGNAQYGGHEALVVFDNVFVPNERVFMCREYEFAGMMVERFAGYHRQSYGGCKVGVGDVLIGAAALAALERLFHCRLADAALYLLRPQLKAHRAPFVLEYDRAAALRDIADDIVKARAELRLRAVHRTVEQPLSGYRNSRALKLGKRPQNIL